MTKSEIYKARYQVYRELGYSSEEARALRSKALDVSLIKINPETKQVVKNKTFKNITGSMTGPRDVKKFVNKAWRVKNDTVFSRWGMLTQDERYRDNTAKMHQFIKDSLKVNNDQAYYFLYYMTTNKMTYKQAKKELLSSKEFEMYVSRGKR